MRAPLLLRILEVVADLIASSTVGLPLYRATGFRDYAKILVAEQDPTVKVRFQIGYFLLNLGSLVHLTALAYGVWPTSGIEACC